MIESNGVANERIAQEARRGVHTDTAEIRGSAIGDLEAADATVERSAVRSLRANDATVSQSALAVLSVERGTVRQSGVGMVIGRGVACDQVRTGILAAPVVRGEVHTWLDLRTALAIGLGMALGRAMLGIIAQLGRRLTQ